MCIYLRTAPNIALKDKLMNCNDDERSVTLNSYMASLYWTVATVSSLGSACSVSAGPDLAGGRPGPSGVFGISKRDWLSNYRVLKIEGFGGRPGARSPPPSPKSGPESVQLLLLAFDCRFTV